MINIFHDFCLSQLDHPINQALVCGKRWPSGDGKNLLINYNLIHLFVVSGAHAIFFEKTLKMLGVSEKPRLSCLGLYVLICNFSSPINRCFLERLSNLTFKSFNFHTPPIQLKLFSAFLCLPFSFFKSELTSLLLSLYFSLIVSSVDSDKAFELKVMLLSLPVYTYFLGFPPFSSIFVLALAGPFIGSILLPLSFLALLSDSVEWLSHKLWWTSLDALYFIEIFLNYPKKQGSSFENWHLLIIHITFLTTITLIGSCYWKRKSYFTFY